ncbi:ABC transporter permease [Moraxella bovoculi]|uniref:LPS export ABC transporter permease LptG n=1 Tax=Moraxella bovoculi TaxID=386891 RepID=UPI0006248D2D|nr:LPS export ABC transporter permease LptG [Moraxella bovoculi]AKG14695.1 LPS export ABC transporter permease LptG [Moraxella bovoculi]AKG16364.1 LPS export ABC transporter permease LptG [Moraxella bovoculi]AKG18105.1 ABC transporter permease [Moraxella bovoculi]NSM11219.1 LPS export ABC transporter permease LptG [Moraxella bovoculi]
MKSHILAKYVIRAAFLAMLGAVLGLWLLQLIFSYLNELEDLNDTYTVMDALKFILYRSPYFLVQFIPTGALLGAVVGLGLLAGNSELVSMQASGVSKYRIISWAMIPASVFVVLSLAVNQYVLPITNQKAEAINTRTPETKLVSVNGYWSVNEHDGGQDIVHISYADSDGVLGETKRYTLDQSSNLTGAMRASSGVYDAKSSDDRYSWQLSDIDVVNINASGVSRTHENAKILTLPIAPTDVHLLTREPEDMSLTDLYAHGQLMNHQGSSSARHELKFWQKLLSPFAVLSLVLVASSFVFGSLRSQGLGLRIVLALLTGLLFSYLTDLTGFIALAANWSPFVMALLPIIISALAGVYLLQKRQ